MSAIDVSGIDETKPIAGRPTTKSVRDNFAAIKTQLSAIKTELEDLSGLADLETARANLGLAIGADVQAYDDTLQSLSSLGASADKLPYTTDVDTWAETSLTPFARSVLDDADAGEAMQTLNGVQVVNTVATLRTIAPNTSRKIWLAYHTTAGDGGHGMFRAVTGAAPGTYTDNGGTIIVPTGGDGSAAWLREILPFAMVPPEWFGAAGDALYFNTNAWYSDAAYTVPATDDTAAINAAIDAAADSSIGAVLLSARYLVDGEIDLHSGVSLVGAGAMQANATGRNGAALCAGWGAASTFDTDRTWTNSVIRIDNYTTLIGGSGLRGFGIYGSPTIGGETDPRAPRCAISQYFGLNGNFADLVIANFEKPAINHVAAQDRDYVGLWIVNCGTNDAVNRIGALEMWSNPAATWTGVAAGAWGTNAIHFQGCRLNSNRTFLMIDGGISNHGEIEFNGCKFESRGWQRYEQSPVYISNGVGAVVFSGGTHFTVPACESSGGTQKYFMDIRNYQTRIADSTLRGEVQFINSTGTWIAISDVTHKSAPYDKYGISVTDGEINNLTVQHDLRTTTKRTYLNLGSGARVNGITFTAFYAATADITSGQLITIPDCTSSGGPSIDGIRIMDDGSGFKQYYRVVESTAGSTFVANAYSSYTRVEKLESFSADTSLTVNNRISVGGTPETIIIDHNAAVTMNRIARGYRGQTVTIGISATLAAAGGLTVTHGTYIKTRSGANFTISSVDDLRTFRSADGVVFVEM